MDSVHLIITNGEEILMNLSESTWSWIANTVKSTNSKK